MLVALTHPAGGHVEIAMPTFSRWLIPSDCPNLRYEEFCGTEWFRIRDIPKWGASVCQPRKQTDTDRVRPCGIFEKADCFRSEVNNFSGEADHLRAEVNPFSPEVVHFTAKSDNFWIRADRFHPEADNLHPECDNFGSEADNFYPKTDQHGPEWDNIL